MPTGQPQDEIMGFYSRGGEAGRLSEGSGLVEKLRTLDILGRYLPKPPATILDVGGASGVYALPLAERGYSVHLVDPVPLHVDQARAASARPGVRPLASATVGDARSLAFDDETADAVLLFGPLYHLTEESDRVQALREARRALKPGGVLFAAAISRFASLVDGLHGGAIKDPVFVEIVKEDLATGRHANRGNPQYFTTAFFHRPGGGIGVLSLTVKREGDPQNGVRVSIRKDGRILGSDITTSDGTVRFRIAFGVYDCIVQDKAQMVTKYRIEFDASHLSVPLSM